MMGLRLLAGAALVAAGAGTASVAAAAPGNPGIVAPPASAESAVTPVHHWHPRCWPVHRWVWTHWGWRYRYVGHRCAPAYRRHYGHPHYPHRPWY